MKESLSTPLPQTCTSASDVSHSIVGILCVEAGSSLNELTLVILLANSARPATHECMDRGNAGLMVVLNSPQWQIGPDVSSSGGEHSGPLVAGSRVNMTPRLRVWLVGELTR